MIRRIFSVVSAAGGNSTSSTTGATHPTSFGPQPFQSMSDDPTDTRTAAPSVLTVQGPRPDVDLVEQRRMVAKEQAELRAKRLQYDREGRPLLSSSSCFPLPYPSPSSQFTHTAAALETSQQQRDRQRSEFIRHSLRSLVVEAHRRQLAKQQQQRQVVGTEEKEVSSSSSYNSVQKQDSPITSTASSGPCFDLTARSTLNALIQDIDTLINMALKEPPQARDRIFEDTYRQVARLSLWSERNTQLVE